MDNTSFSPSVQLRGEASADAELIACFIENLIRRLRCTARTVKSDGICITRDAMRSPFSRISDENRQERYCAGVPRGICSLILFASAKNCIDQLSFDCWMPAVSKWISPETAYKILPTSRIALFDDRINLSSANKIRECLRVGLYWNTQ